MGVWAYGCVLCGGMSIAMGSKFKGKVFRLRIRLEVPVEISVESKKPFFDLYNVKESHIRASVENGRFRLTNPTV